MKILKIIQTDFQINEGKTFWNKKLKTNTLWKI